MGAKKKSSTSGSAVESLTQRRKLGSPLDPRGLSGYGTSRLFGTQRQYQAAMGRAQQAATNKPASPSPAPTPKPSPVGSADARLQQMQDLLKGQLESTRSQAPSYTPTPAPAPVVAPRPTAPAAKPSAVSPKLQQQTANPLPPAVNLEEAYRKQLDLLRQQMQQQASAQNGILSQLQRQMQDEVAGRDKQLALYQETEARQAEQERLMMAEREKAALNQRRAYEESFMDATMRLRQSAARRATYQNLNRTRPVSPTPEFQSRGLLR